jgi:hypothetical protein
MRSVIPVLLFAGLASADPPTLEQEANTWVKRSPLKDAPTSPGMGYETSLGYDPVSKRVIRWGGHNQGGGGEQNAETWVLDPVTMKWELKEPNRSPPGVCCAQQNLFDPIAGRFLRFPAFSGSHGWHWFRENYLTNTSVWSYDLAANRWRDLRPVPTPHPAPLRCASWDSHHQVAVSFGGEGGADGVSVYDPYTNTWTRLRQKVQPAPRSGGNMAYDPVSRQHILFGTQFGDDPHTWAYDLAKNEWRDLKPGVQPPTDRNDAVLAYDPAGKVIIAVVRAIDAQKDKEVAQGHLETWAYDAGKNEWKAMKPAREPDGWGNRRRVLVPIPDQHVLLMEAYANPTERIPGVEREQQIWTYRYADLPAAATALAAPTGVSVTALKGSATLSWQPDRQSPAEKIKIYRGEGEVPWPVSFTLIATVPAQLPQPAPAGKIKPRTFTDNGLGAGKTYHYFLRAVDADGHESEDSIRVRTQPRVVEDAIVAVVSPHEVRLNWVPPRAGPAVAYHVERAVVEVFSDDEVLRLKKDTAPLAEPSVGAIRAIGSFVRLTREPLTGVSFTDTAVDLSKPLPIAGEPIAGEPIYRHRFRPDQLDAKGKPYGSAVYAYRIRAVNELGVESGPSPYFLTIPSAPESVFAREDGAQCHLKWAHNPEAKLKGYRVYRMEGPRINGPGQKVTRLTPEPIAEPHWTDMTATKDTKRYWIVAVDALGQEGMPSAPVWHYRQYRKYYEPFIGEWHQ